MLENIKAVIFDLDGTMVDSMWVWAAIDKDFIYKYDLKVPDNFYQEMEGKSFTETAQYFLEIFPELNMTLDELKNSWTDMAFEKYTKEVEIKDGLYGFLEELQKRNIYMGIATSNGRELVEAVLEAKGINQFFRSVRTSCEVKAGKPAPDVYLKVAEELHVQPEECLVFEDVPMGILAGKNAGMKVCAVEDTFSEQQVVKKRKLADYYIQNYNDIKNKTYEVL